MTSAEADTTHRAPAFSPDGGSMAFASCGGFHQCALYVAPLVAGIGPVGPVRSVAKGGLVHVLAWTPDGEALVYSAFAMAAHQLWRVSLSDGAEPQLLRFAPPSSDAPAISRTRFRMAYSYVHRNDDIWTIENGGLTKTPLSSTFNDSHAVFSPDGKKIAFSSFRTGNAEVWVANPDGSNLQQLTTSRASASPRWSPDGRSIVYDTMAPDGSWDVSLIDAAGGSPIPIVRHPGEDAVPSFSHDGNWIYFSSNRAGKTQIYRVPSAGGDPVRLTDNGGWIALESADGKSIYYTKENDACGQPLFVRPVAGGPERQIIDSLCTRTFAETEQGIYYIGPTGGIPGIHLYDPASGKSRVVREMSRLANFLSASTDGKKILAVIDSSTGGDLYLVENFR